MITDIVVVKHTTEVIDKLVATYSKLDQAATAAKWKELDVAVDKSIAGIDKGFSGLGNNCIKVRAFLSQKENPGRKAILESIIGFPADLTWTSFLTDVAGKLCMSLRNLQDKLQGIELGVTNGQGASSVLRAEKKEAERQKQLAAGAAATTAALEINDTASEWAGTGATKVWKPGAVNALVAAATAANNVVEAVDAGFDPGPAIANLKNNTISGRKLNAILLAVDTEAKAKDAPAPADSIGWKAQLVKLLDALDADCMTQHLNKRTKAVISEVEGLVNPVPAVPDEAREAKAKETKKKTKAPKAGELATL
jgi:hypothetical protein